MKKSIIATLAAVAVAALGVPMFSGCSAQVGYILKTDENGDHYYSATLEGFTASLKGEVVIPETYKGYPVKEIEPQGFSGTYMTKITIPASIEKIGTAAFSYNSSLTQVVFADGSSLEEISWGSFAYCTGLESIDIPSSVKTVAGMAFYGCDSLRTVNLPYQLERIKVQAFSECTALTTINFPQELISIGAAAFYNCVSLQSVILPDGMRDTEIPSLDEEGNEETDKDGNPVTVTIPALGAVAFFGCDDLELAVLGEGITIIPEGLFGSCVSLKTLYLPSTLTEVKGMYSSGNTDYGHAFYNTKKLTNVYFAGTEEEWAKVKIDDTVYKNKSDNSALINADKIFNTSYKG